MQEICQSSGSSACIVLPDIGMSSQSTPSQLRSRGANDTPSVLQCPNLYVRVFPLNEIDKLKDSFIFPSLDYACLHYPNQAQSFDLRALHMIAGRSPHPFPESRWRPPMQVIYCATRASSVSYYSSPFVPPVDQSSG
jgi:hypothetical protein